MAGTRLPLRAGELRERVTIEQPTTAPDTVGGTTATWSTLATVWAKCDYVRGGDAMQAEETVPRRQYDVTIRKRTDLAQKMRLVRGSQTLAILAINDSTLYLDCLVVTCEETLP